MTHTSESWLGLGVRGYRKGEVDLAGDKNQVSGNTAMLLLQLLSERDMYGYEMIEELLRRSNHVFDLKAGTLYPLLHGMEARSVLVSYEKEAGGKMRRYYRITKEGRKELERRREEWQIYSGAVAQVMTADSEGLRRLVSDFQSGVGMFGPSRGRGGDFCGA